MPLLGAGAAAGTALGRKRSPRICGQVGIWTLIEVYAPTQACCYCSPQYKSFFSQWLVEAGCARALQVVVKGRHAGNYSLLQLGHEVAHSLIAQWTTQATVVHEQE